MTPFIAFYLFGSAGFDYLHQVAKEVTSASRVAPDAEIKNGGKNTTGFAVRVPGGTQTFYPAFWVRDAAMMLGADLVPAEEVEGWIKVVAITQPGPSGLKFDHGLVIPPYSIPDHITLSGEACWFPGAYANQGVGDYGFLPPADDAFYFIQMVWEARRLEGKKFELAKPLNTRWGPHPLIEVCEKAFDSVETDPTTGLVVCDATQGRRRVDWGFCDSITKSGSCLMPSLLRWQSARRLAEMHGRGSVTAKRYLEVADLIKKSIVSTFLIEPNGLLVSATGVGRKDDVWASAFAVWLGLLPPSVEKQISRHLLDLYEQGGTVVSGQVRSLPPTGPFGGSWDDKPAPGLYQNGGYWATPTGWMIAALEKVDKDAAARLFREYIDYVRTNRSQGAPFEWINPTLHKESNGNYGSSAGLVYISLLQSGYRG